VALVDHVDHRFVVDPGHDEVDDAALAAEILGEPAEDSRQEQHRAAPLDAHAATDVIHGRLLDLPVELAAVEGAQRRRGAAG
jgi:hypothetical protein